MNVCSCMVTQISESLDAKALLLTVGRMELNCPIGRAPKGKIKLIKNKQMSYRLALLHGPIFSKDMYFSIKIYIVSFAADSSGLLN